MKKIKLLYIFYFSSLISLFSFVNKSYANLFSDQTFIIAEGNKWNITTNQFWNFIEENTNIGIEISVSDLFSDQPALENGLINYLNKVKSITDKQESKIIPVFLNYEGDISLLDSLILSSEVSSNIFYLPQGEAWPTTEYLIQSNRRIILFVDGNFNNTSRLLHNLKDYVLKISADENMGEFDLPENELKPNQELFMIDNFDKLKTKLTLSFDRNLTTYYINYLLENWKKYGKRPNFIFTGTSYAEFDLTVSQLNSFTWINGSIKVSGKTIDRVYWKNQDISVTTGKFSFPYRGGEELMLSPFVPGYKLTPEQIIITGEMEVHEEYSIIANPVELSNSLTGKFEFENNIRNLLNPDTTFTGENFSFSEDIERGNVIKLPENASVNLGNPENYGLRNSSFTVSCFVKFSDILEFGDNAILGNYEQEYRRGLHLILRSGHPYFGLWANDYVSNEKLLPNKWYHMVWRYIIETGEQAIFLNGKNIGSSIGHPPFSGNGDILLGSALSEGASLRGYVDDLYFWSRPLGNEEINRLSLNEEVQIEEIGNKLSISRKNVFQFFILFIILTILLTISILLYKKVRYKGLKHTVKLPEKNASNQVQLFSEFRAINNKGENITKLFTPKVKELFLYILIYTVRNGKGAITSELNGELWPGIEHKKVANNRAVTLNKLRKILNEIEGIEIEIQDQNIIAVMQNPFFCDYIEAIKLCRNTGKISRQELETFYQLVKKGSFLKGTTFYWLDDIRGFTGNQVIDNLLNLAVIYKNEKNYEGINSIANRILDYDELSEEAIYLQIWTLLKSNNSHLAKFNFNSFCSKYEKSMGEPFSMNFEQFVQHYSGRF